MQDKNAPESVRQEVETSAAALLGMAHEHQRAAEHLSPHAEDVEYPLYFMHVHAIELALKAYLRI